MLRASCLKLEINELGCYEAKIEESEKGRQPPGVEPTGIHIEDCEGWWLSSCRGSVAEHWQLKPESTLTVASSVPQHCDGCRIPSTLCDLYHKNAQF